MCAFVSSRGEYALAEYTEVKAVTIKLNEPLWDEHINLHDHNVNVLITGLYVWDRQLVCSFGK